MSAGASSDQCKMGKCATLAVIIFNIVLVLCTLPSYFIAKVGLCIGKCKPLGKDSIRRKFVFMSSLVGWRLLFTCCCWVRLKVTGLKEFRQGFCASGRGTILIANHMSFLDTIILVSLLPICKVAKVKMFVSSHLFKMPVLRTIVEAMGHLAVPFKADGAGGGMELDKDLMAIRQAELAEHIRNGGIGGWYPEGIMNKGPCTQVGQFRAGGFAIAAIEDVEIWCVAFCGNNVCWPGKAAVGGRPATIGVDIFKLCSSSKEMLANSGVTDQRQGSIFLADLAQSEVQKRVVQLAASGCDGLEKPLLAT